VTDLSSRARKIEDFFAEAGFKGPVAVHMARTPFNERMWSHLTPPVSQNATQKRRYDFSDGRELAGRCLASIGAEPQMIGRGQHREPLWPGGICGSITHTQGLVAAVAGFEGSALQVGLGLDAERITPLAAFDCAHLFTREERAFLANVAEANRAAFATCFFSAKEAIFKAQFPLTTNFVEYNEVSLLPTTIGSIGRSGFLHLRRVVPQLSGFTVTAFYNAVDEFMITGCVIASPGR
jgi:4'-phosphopantetheinyl transferase EntD